MARIFSRQGWNSLLLGLTILISSVLQAEGPTSAQVPFDSSNAQVHDLVGEIVSEADAGRDAGAYITMTADLGVDAAIECARHLDAAHPLRNSALLEVISLAAQSRRSNREVLKLYDPSAYRFFYLPAGLNDQELVGKALLLPQWPSKLPEAMVHAAPLPTMQWMRQQAKLDQPAIGQLILIWQTWGFWARVGHERQYLAELGDVVSQLATNRAITSDADASAALVRFAGEVEARGSSDFITATLANGATPARAEAAVACGRLASEAAASAIILAAGHEEDGLVQQKIAIAAESWLDLREMGEAMLELFNRSHSAPARREILFTASKANWPTRGDLLLRAFDLPDDGVLGAALIAMSVQREPRCAQPMLEIAQRAKIAEPPLIDALGESRDSRAVPHLLRWLGREENPVVRVKLLLALEKTANHEADRALLQLLSNDPTTMVVEQTIGVIARRQISGGETTLISMAFDKTAPMQLRVQAIWAMGHFDTPAIRQALDKLEREPEKYFKSPIDEKGKPAYSETIDMARLFVALDQIQLHEPGADAALQAAYERGTAVAQMTALVMLAQLGYDHPIIAQGLSATDTAILFGATRAAMAANPRKYHETLIRLRHAPFVEALLNSGLDSANLRPSLDAAIAAGGKP